MAATHEGLPAAAAAGNGSGNGNGNGGPGIGEAGNGNGNASTPNPNQDQEPGQVEQEGGGEAGDDAATDAGASSLPPSEIGGRAPLDTGCSDADGGAASSLAGGIVGPPSPLTGCYLLIVLGEPHSEEHKDNILQHLLKGKWRELFPSNTIYYLVFRRKHSSLQLSVESMHIEFDCCTFLVSLHEKGPKKYE